MALKYVLILRQAQYAIKTDQHWKTIEHTSIILSSNHKS